MVHVAPEFCQAYRVVIYALCLLQFFFRQFSAQENEHDTFKVQIVSNPSGNPVWGVTSVLTSIAMMYAYVRMTWHHDKHVAPCWKTIGNAI